ncbi:MAG: sodium:alanine symporter family protein [Oscillospiraceae bacterium]|nr:sodium:alanine symporter family protein [Oscillospiraceae bacterium]
MQVLNDMVGFFTGTLNTVAWLYIFLPFAIVGGIYLTIRTGAVQFSRFGYMLRNTVGKMFRSAKAGKGEVTPLQAVTTALAATVGTGNIVGTSQAIALGGYGAVFWLWIAALVGMVTKYSEVTLAVKYRERDDKGDWVGGPMYYIKNGMGKGWGWLAILFSIFAALASFGIGNMSQVNSVTGSLIGAVQAFTTVPDETALIMRWVIGLLLALLIGIILIGGIKRIGSVTEKLIPFMSLLYIIFTLVVIFGNIGSLGDAFGKIFSTAFTPEAMFGAASGIVLKNTIIWGLRRSAFSNEAGLGSAAIAHAATSEKDPVKQGLYGIFEVFADTIVICTLTALTIIVSGVDIQFGVKPGSELITAAFATVFGGKIASVFVTVALMLFAFSTVLGWALYGTRCVQYLFGTKAILWYRILFVAVAVVGCVTSIDVVWDVADTFNGLMAIPNFIAVFALSGVVAKLTRDHFRAEKELRK